MQMVEFVPGGQCLFAAMLLALIILQLVSLVGKMYRKKELNFVVLSSVKVLICK